MKTLLGWMHIFVLRFHFAYRHSFRSGMGVRAFCEYWEFASSVYDKPKHFYNDWRH